MQAKPDKLSLKAFRDIALLCQIVTQCRVLSFRDDAAIATLGKECEQAVLYYEGDKLLGLIQDLESVSREAVEANKKQYEEMRESGASDEVIARAMNVDGNKAADSVIKKIDELLKKEYKNEIETVFISDGEYKKEFDDQVRQASCLAGYKFADGYQALLSLISMKWVVGIASEPEVIQLAPSMELVN